MGTTSDTVGKQARCVKLCPSSALLTSARPKKQAVAFPQFTTQIGHGDGKIRSRVVLDLTLRDHPPTIPSLSGQDVHEAQVTDQL